MTRIKSLKLDETMLENELAIMFLEELRSYGVDIDNMEEEDSIILMAVATHIGYCLDKDEEQSKTYFMEYEKNKQK